MRHLKRVFLYSAVLLPAVGLLAAALVAFPQTGSTGTRVKVIGIVATRNHPPATPARPAASGSAPFNGIPYNGGEVMDDPGGTNVYFIWYGGWNHDTTAQTILTDFIKHIGGTAYFNINSSYYDYDKEGEKVPVPNRVNYKGSITDNYSFGTALTDDDVGLIIQNAVTSGKLPFDLNGQYFVLTSMDVRETSGFCTSYCAWHGYRQLPNGDKLVGSFVGDPTTQCPDICAVSPPNTPNNDFAADSMATMIAHELSESVTDPYGDGWVAWPDGIENGDLCTWTWGNYKRLPDGSYYNVKFGKRPYLIQQIWVNARGGYCATALDE